MEMGNTGNLEKNREPRKRRKYGASKGRKIRGRKREENTRPQKAGKIRGLKRLEKYGSLKEEKYGFPKKEKYGSLKEEIIRART